MANEKSELIFSKALPHEDPSNITSPIMPPPYEDVPPPYSSLVDNNCTGYTSALPVPDYMDKLPYDEPSSRCYYSQTPPAEVPSYSRPHVDPQVGLANQQLLYPHPPNSLLPSQQGSTSTAPQVANHQLSYPHPPNSLLPSQQGSASTAPHKVLLQPTISRVVETTAIGRRKTKSHVTDLETGKEYFVEEKTSRNGRRNKTVINEVGGPKTYIKETPKRTVVCQKKK